jgi:hypothetical protein
MTWIDDRLSERKAEEVRRSRIFSEAPRLHGELWREIIIQIDEARKKGFGKILIPSPGSEILLPVEPAPGSHSASPRKLSLELKKDHSAIVAKIGDGDLTLPVEADSDRVVLKYEGNTLTVSNAATVVLDQFLFPELKRLDVNHLIAWKGPQN